MITLTKDDFFFLVAMASKGVVFMHYYQEKGASKAQARLDSLTNGVNQVKETE